VNVAAISLGALFLAIIVSCTTPIHVGFLSIALAWFVGVYVAGMSANAVMSGFPTTLFLTLTGVTLLFAQAQANGTLDRVAHHAVRYCRGNVGVMPMMFFVLAFLLSSIGPGNIASCALIAPIAMPIAGQVGIPAFLMAIMIGNGANAGALSPIAPTGIIVNGIMDNVGLAGYQWHTYLNNAAAHASIAFAAYFLLGGWRLLGRYHREAVIVPANPGDGKEQSGDDLRFDTRHWITLAIIGALITGVIFFEVNVGLGAFAGAMVLTALRAGDDVQAVKLMPWKVIMMVCGVTVLIALLEKTGGMDLFTRILAGMSTSATVVPVISFATGFISMYSSTSGVVLPAMLPTVPGLVEQLGGVEPIAVASAMNVGGHLVDVSPLSTLGALCMAGAAAHEDPRALFNKLLAWGISMTIVGALVCYLLFVVAGIGIN
jgi:Na+/H+ antiporter NhaD/arsenite permease-like protein